MKVANIVCAWPPYAGGIAGSAKQISEIIGTKHEVTNFHPDTEKFILRRGHGAFMPFLLFKLKDFDYIYLHYPFFGTSEVVWLFKLLYKKPKLIIHYHMDVKNKGLINKALSLPSILIRNSLLKKADYIVSASLDYIENSQIKKFYQQNKNKFREIPFAIDLKKFKPKEINIIGGNKIINKAKELVHFVNENFIKKDKVDLLFVGGLDRAHYFKGIKDLLEALSKIENTNWKLKIVGDGDLRKEYESLSKILNISNKVEFTGKLPDEDLLRSYQNSDLLILPSINNNEAFGIVIIEALACGVPVLASNLAGVRKVFTNNKEGLLFEAGNIEDLKNKLNTFIQDKNKRKEMSQKARDLAVKKYGLDDMKKEIEKLFV